MANLNLKIGALVNEIEGLNSSINYIQKNIDERSNELAFENAKHFDVEVYTCPMCFYEFQDQAKLEMLETIKQDNIKRLTGVIAQAQNEKGNLEKKKQEKVEAKINLENERTAKQDGINRLTELLNNAVEEVKAASENYHNETLESEISVLRAFLIENEGKPIETLKSAYAKDLEAQIECLEAKANQDFNKIDHTSEIEALNTQIMALDDEIKQLYIAEEKFDTKQALQKRLETLTTEFNDNSNVLARCVDMIHTFIS